MLTKSISAALVTSLVVSSVACVTPADSGEARSQINLTITGTTEDGVQRTLALHSEAGEAFTGTQTDISGAASDVEEITMPFAMATWPRLIKHDAQGDFIEVGGSRAAVTNIVRGNGTFSADFEMAPGRTVNYQLQGEVDHFIQYILIGAAIAIAAYYCSSFVQQTMDRCDKRNGNWKYDYYLGICSGSCTK